MPKGKFRPITDYYNRTLLQRATLSGNPPGRANTNIRYMLDCVRKREVLTITTLTLRAFVLSASLLILCQLAVAPFASAEDKWDYWNQFQLKTSLKEKTDLKVKSEQRLRNNFADHYMTNFELGLVRKHNKQLEFGAIYKYEDEKSTSGKRTTENRFSLEGTYKWDAHSFRLSNRHRISHRNISGTTSWRYRFKLKASYPIKTDGFMFTPYLAGEAFYDNIPEKINQTRFAAGFSKRLTGNLKLEIYYLLKSKLKGRKWTDLNVLGTGFSVSF